MNYAHFISEASAFQNNWTVGWGETLTDFEHNKFAIAKCYDSSNGGADYLLIYLDDSSNRFTELSSNYHAAKAACSLYDSEYSLNDGNSIILSQAEIALIWNDLSTAFIKNGKVVEEDGRFFRLRKFES